MKSENDMTDSNWEVVIGLEVHVQLLTKSKLFSGASTAYGAAPNTQACEIDLGLPGVLPVLNQTAVEMAVKFGLSIGAKINPKSVFARKNYFYPDLPKGYQVSQFDLPIIESGKLEIVLENNETKTIGVTRAHLEEDAGKSLHGALANMSGIDLNRAGTPLLEIVSEPELSSAKEAVAYLKTLHALVRYLDICDGNLQEGSFRCDANVSIRRPGEPLGTRAEIKNINSFRFVEKAINYEILRQRDILENGGKIIQETRLYDADKDETRSMRSKENANDYRYFPDPDLLPVILEKSYIDNIKSTLPELPREKRERFHRDYKLSEYEANLLSYSREIATYYESAAKLSDPKLSANWILGELSAVLNKQNLDIKDSKISAELLADLINKITDKTISNNLAKKVFEIMWETGHSAEKVIEEHNLKQVTDTSAIVPVIEKILSENADKVAEYKAGKDKLFGFFVGLAMKATQGKANPAQLNELLKEYLSK